MEAKKQTELEYIQIGVIAQRDEATGEFLPAEPIYIRATPTAKAAEEKISVDIAKIFAEKMRQYVEGGGLSPAECNLLHQSIKERNR